MAQMHQWQPRGPVPDRSQNFFHFPRFQANQHLQYRHHFGGQHHRFHHRNKPFVFHNRNHEPMDPDRVLRQSFRDNFRDLAIGGGRYHHRQPKGEGSHDDANIVELPGGINAKQMKKPTQRKTVDYNSSVVNYLENRVWQRDGRDRRAFNPDKLHHLGLIPPQAVPENPMNAVATRHIRTSVNKNKCPIFSVAWTPEGRRLVTGAHSGEFVLWNGLTFNFETILQAHDTSVRAMRWSHNDLWMITADHNGFIKYWQSNMNNVKMYQAHKESIRALSFCPSDTKFASCSDDGTVRIWDFARCTEERILRGHGADVKCVDWHPQKSIVISGSKDAQQPIKLWDPRTGVALTTLHAHKNTCMDVKWGMNGHLFLTASRDHLIKLFDVRNMREEVLTYKGHKKEVTNVAWNPIHESLFASSGSDGSIMFWTTNGEKEVGCMHQAHDGLIWSLSWHPVGHILASGSNDHCVKFWGRNRLGDTMRDRYNLNLNPTGMAEDEYYDETAAEGVSLIPGMGIEQPSHQEESVAGLEDTIPGFDWTDEDLKVMALERRREGVGFHKSKPLKHAIRRVPESFERAWESGEQTVVTPKIDLGVGASDDVKVEDLMGAPIMQPVHTGSRNNNSPMLKLSSLNIEMEMAQLAKMNAMASACNDLPQVHDDISVFALPDPTIARSLGMTSQQVISSNPSEIKYPADVAVPSERVDASRCLRSSSGAPLKLSENVEDVSNQLPLHNDRSLAEGNDCLPRMLQSDTVSGAHMGSFMHRAQEPPLAAFHFEMGQSPTDVEPMRRRMKRKYEDGPGPFGNGNYGPRPENRPDDYRDDAGFVPAPAGYSDQNHMWNDDGFVEGNEDCGDHGQDNHWSKRGDFRGTRNDRDPRRENKKRGGRGRGRGRGRSRSGRNR